MVQMSHKVFGVVGTPQQQPEQKMSVDDMKSLINLGCIRDSITLGALTFQFCSLNATQGIELARFLGENPSSDLIFSFNIKLLAMAIETVNGKPLETFHPEFNSGRDALTLCEEIISSMQSPVIVKLISFYNRILERGDAQFEKQELKNL